MKDLDSTFAKFLTAHFPRKPTCTSQAFTYCFPRIIEPLPEEGTSPNAVQSVPPNTLDHSRSGIELLYDFKQNGANLCTLGYGSLQMIPALTPPFEA